MQKAEKYPQHLCWKAKRCGCTLEGKKDAGVLTCYLCNDCLRDPSVGQEGFDFLFYHTAVPPAEIGVTGGGERKRKNREN